ncbi:MAG: hypothetical protein MHPSP_001480 [Paramarteilia canceri]
MFLRCLLLATILSLRITGEQEEEEEVEATQDPLPSPTEETKPKLETISVLSDFSKQCFYFAYTGPYLKGYFVVQNNHQAVVSINVDNTNVYKEKGSSGSFRIKNKPGSFIKICYSLVSKKKSSKDYEGLLILFGFEKEYDMLEEISKSLSRRKDYLSELETSVEKLMKKQLKAISDTKKLNESILKTEATITYVTVLTQVVVFWNVIYFLYTFFNMFKQRAVC